MEKDKIIETAAQMFLRGAGRKEVLNFLTENEIPGEEAESIATNAYAAVKEQIKAAKESKAKEAKKQGYGLMGVGALIILGNIGFFLAYGSLYFIPLIAGIAVFVAGYNR